MSKIERILNFIGRKLEKEITSFGWVSIYYTIIYYVLMASFICIGGLTLAFIENGYTGILFAILGFGVSILAFGLGIAALHTVIIATKYAPILLGLVTLVQALDGFTSGLDSMQQAYGVGSIMLLFGIWNATTALHFFKATKETYHY